LCHWGLKYFPQFFLGQMVQRKIWDLAWFSR
jgi:hypothetical protein